MRAVRLRQGPVVLRAFKALELDVVVREFRSDEGAAAGIPLPTRAQLRRRIEGSGKWDRGWIQFAIEADGRLIGDIQGRGNPREAMPPGVIDIGLTLFDAADRGRGYGTVALKLLTRWLLGPGGAARVQGSTGVGNKAMRRAFTKAGYKREGTLRSFMPGARGRRTDYVLYAKTKG